MHFDYAGSGAGTGSAGANVFMLSESGGDSATDSSGGWQVEAIVERTAAEHLEELVSAQDWPAAFDLARQTGLSADPVHKCAPHEVNFPGQSSRL